jgi:hypothetical protein
LTADPEDGNHEQRETEQYKQTQSQFVFRTLFHNDFVTPWWFRVIDS